MFKRCYFKELQNILGIFYYPVGAYLIHGCSSAFRNQTIKCFLQLNMFCWDGCFYNLFYRFRLRKKGLQNFEK